MLREMLSERDLEEFERIIDELIELNRYVPVVVEGAHDVEALRHLGLDGEILTVNQGKSLVALAECLSEHEEIVLFLDWDRKGEELTRRLTELLDARAVNYHPEFRERIRHIAGHVRTVEALIL